ncbi:MAG: hypothetical protein ACP5HS_05635 [Anaerolineae bacterium]
MNPFIVWLDRFSELVSVPAAWGIFVTGAVIYVVSAWRIRFLALIVQYLFVGVLFTRVFDTRPEMAMMKVLVGWLICGALLLSARIRYRSVRETGDRWRWAANLPFRVLILVTATVIARLASERFALPYVSADLGLACFLLVVLALLFFGTEEEDPGVVGVGVLNLLAALELFYAAQDPGLLVSGLLVIVNLLVGLAISYLTVSEVPT